MLLFDLPDDRVFLNLPAFSVLYWQCHFIMTSCNTNQLQRPLCSSQAANDNFEFDLTNEAYNYFSNHIVDCEYIDPAFNIIRNTNSLMLAHLNIRSLHKNFDDMHDIFTAWKRLPDMICLF